MEEDALGQSLESALEEVMSDIPAGAGADGHSEPLEATNDETPEQEAAGLGEALGNVSVPQSVPMCHGSPGLRDQGSFCLANSLREPRWFRKLNQTTRYMLCVWQRVVPIQLD